MTATTAIHRSLVKTLLEVHNTGGSGVVRLQRGSEKKQLVLRQGCLVFAESNMQDDHLVRVLLKMNLLPRSTVPKIAAVMKEGKTSERAILEATNLREPEIMQGVREQAVQILASLFGWETAEIQTYRGAAPPTRQIDLKLPLPEFVVVSARRAVAQRTIPSNLKTLKGKLAPDTTSISDLLVLPLDSGEALTLSHVQQPATADGLIPGLSLPGAKPEELLQRLLLLGFLRLQEEDAGTAGEGRPGGKAEGVGERLDELLRQFEVANFYEILSVTPDAADSDIKAAYHELAKLYHPDHFQAGEFGASIRPRAERVFTYVTGAYRTLGDAALRAAYDADRLKKDSRVESALQARSAIDLEREKMAEALYRAGRISYAKRDFEKAAEQLKECVWLRPDIARYQQSLGTAQAEIPKLRKEAEQHLLKAIELDAMQADSYLALGKLYLKVNLPRKAELQFQEFLRWDPSNVEAVRLLQELATGGTDHHRGHGRSKTPIPRS